MTSLTLAERLGLPERGEPSEPPPPLPSFPPLPGGGVAGGREGHGEHTRTRKHTHTHAHTHTRTGSGPPHPPAQANPGTRSRAGRKSNGTGRNAHAGAPRTGRTLGHGPARLHSPPGSRARFRGETRSFGAAARYNEIGGPDASSPRCSAAFGPRGPGGTGRGPPSASRAAAAPRCPPHVRTGGSVPAAPGGAGDAPEIPGRVPTQSGGVRGPPCPQGQALPAATSSPAGPQTRGPVALPGKGGKGRELCPPVKGTEADPPPPRHGNRVPPRTGPPPRGRLQHLWGSAAAACPSPQPKLFPGQAWCPGHPRPAETLEPRSHPNPPGRWHPNGPHKFSAPLPQGPQLCRLSKGLIFPGFKPSPAVSELRALSLALFF